MKHLLDPYLRLAAVFLGGSLLVSFLFSVLYYFNWMGTPIYQIGCLLCGVLLYAVCGILFAQKAKRKVLLQALVLLIVLVVLGVLLMEEKSWAALGALAAKGIFFLAGCVVMIGKHN